MSQAVSAILLAAGASRRMGRLKQLLPLGPKLVIQHCLDNIVSSGIKDIVVVLGYRGHEIREAIKDFPVSIISNKNPWSEMAESIRYGLSAINNLSTAVLVCLADHPLVSPKTLDILINNHRHDPLQIIIPCYRGKRGHPSLFPRSAINAIFQDFNLREIIMNNPERVRFIDVFDEGIIRDMDTPEDYRQMREIVKNFIQE